MVSPSKLAHLRPKWLRNPISRGGKYWLYRHQPEDYCEAKVGDTVTLAKSPALNPLPGYKNVLPFVYAGFFPVSNDQYQDLQRRRRETRYVRFRSPFRSRKILLFSASVSHWLPRFITHGYYPRGSEREFNLDLVVTNPSTNYEVTP